ncbi:SPOR domain-containing protein [Prosthecochloris sp.]|uniref:SPOR domain-containing protein n=1 Tax=Prosthecochloris sp. TaxID=290513 RepID=UPI0025D49186|nr:SPOR domain-containing protein [Prosthecochloris sp.]
MFKILLKTSLFVLLLSIGYQVLPATSLAERQTTDYRVQIIRYVEQDKIYLLENLRSKVTNKAEQTIIDALLTEDGPQAARLFRKQLQDYPDPSLDSLSKARLAAYQSALSSTSGTRTRAIQTSFILQFGSFGSLENARELANRIAPYTPVTIFQEKGLHKVRTQKAFGTRQEAETGAKKLPFNSFIVRIN